jgi:hypothetical protein
VHLLLYQVTRAITSEWLDYTLAKFLRKVTVAAIQHTEVLGALRNKTVPFLLYAPYSVYPSLEKQ